ncbi:hypothetical protein, partial [Pseudomonas sp. L13]|uniref:hypothetical protein n=1 Tax=Pseudomonas sp. L13 TaxID=343985 RepID=UPI001C498CE0
RALAIAASLTRALAIAASLARTVSMASCLTSSLATRFTACKATGGWATFLCGRTLAIIETAISTEWDHLRYGTLTWLHENRQHANRPKFKSTAFVPSRAVFIRGTASMGWFDHQPLRTETIHCGSSLNSASYAEVSKQTEKNSNQREIHSSCHPPSL